MYKAKVKYNGNHYFADQEVRGSKIRTNEDGTVELFDDEPIKEFPFYGGGREEWVEVEPESIVNLEDKVVFKLNQEQIQKWVLGLDKLDSLSNYCKTVEKDYDVNIELKYDVINDYYYEVIITGQDKNIQALIYDGMFEELADLTDGTTEQIYDEQHGQKYYGPWDW